MFRFAFDAVGMFASDGEELYFGIGWEGAEFAASIFSGVDGGGLGDMGWKVR